MNRLTLIFLILLFTPTLRSQDTRIPKTEKAFNAASENFRFAVVSDRSGGMRKGIFASAMDKVNLLQPEFVLSVGDLIDGYTEDPLVWNQQWNEFDSIINRLEMPFYYVAGNHDVSNELLTKIWREKYGRDYYHFVYKDVLFLALNTDEVKDGGISEKQAAYVSKALADNTDVNWTLLFMHRPLWSYGDQAGYQTIESALENRNHTVFSGHHHNYQYQEKNGMAHYVLATTGGGSNMRGAEIGEFDHIAWVTMKQEGPEVALIDINGVYDKNLIPQKDYSDIELLRRGTWLTIDPIVLDTETFTAVELNIKVVNEMQREMDVSGALIETEDIVFEPATLVRKVKSGEEQNIKVMAKSKSGKPISIEVINNKVITIELNGGFKREQKKPINLSASKRIVLDWKHSLNQRTGKIVIDGNKDDWESENFNTVTYPQYFQEEWDWKGSEDGKFSFSTSIDAERLYIVVDFKDNVILSNPADITGLQDKFYIHLNPTIAGTEDYYELEFAATEHIKKPLMNKNARELRGIKAAVSKNSEGELLEFSVPLKSIGAENVGSIKINIGVMDHDRPENTKPSVLWWRPIWNSKESYDQSSIFTNIKN